MNESIPATIGAIIVVLIGSVSISDLGIISNTISGAAITIMATIVMAIVLNRTLYFFEKARRSIVHRAQTPHGGGDPVKSRHACQII